MEAGEHTLDEPNCIQPGRYLRLRLSPTEIFTSHVAKPSSALRGRSPIVASGRALGGGSSVNCMKDTLLIDAQTDLGNQAACYARAAASDYDDWENVYGNKGWGSKYLIPLLKKVRTLQSTPSDLENNYGNFFIGRNISTSFNELYTRQIRSHQSVVSRTTLEHLQRFLICC